jgi:polysaccharide pyruvyl transferase WcaK-like protein
MKIAVLGYYHALNAGDDRLQFCINRLVQEHTVVFLPHYLVPPKEYLQDFDWILIGGGGLVFEPVGIWANPQRWLAKCRAKIGVLGLGVNRVDADLLQAVTQIIERSTFFYVRDQPSWALLNYHPQVEVYTDLSWCFPLMGWQELEAGIALNLLPCAWKTFNLDDWVEALVGHEVHPFPFHFGKDRDADLLRRYFGDRTPTEFSLKPLQQCELLVTCRFHGIIFAMQMGKPFVAINYDDKVQRLLADAELSECLLETTEPMNLVEKIQLVVERRALFQEKMATYAQGQKQKAQQMMAAIDGHLTKPRQRGRLNGLAKQLLRGI